MARLPEQIPWACRINMRSMLSKEAPCFQTACIPRPQRRVHEVTEKNSHHCLASSQRSSCVSKSTRSLNQADSSSEVTMRASRWIQCHGC